ncbi:MAG: electron transport complex subunit E [Clostridiales Family XIII bacterium]|jgi:electron transport complex protein RnfE|nr:electron transport complex subunit E [Clostridiales Family XIII bacterium]
MSNGAGDSKIKKSAVLLNGVLKENPVLVLLLGTCPTLAVTTQAVNGIGMGLATMAVLICSNVVISLLKNVISDRVRIPCFIVVIAGFVTIVGMMMEAYIPSLYKALGLFIPLIVVNCIVLGRAEMFASKNGVVVSALDGLGMGLGFTIALFIMGSVREMLGSGSWMGMQFLPEDVPTMSIFMLAPGGFFVFGVLVAVVRKIPAKGVPFKKDFGCEECGGCPDDKDAKNGSGSNGAKNQSDGSGAKDRPAGSGAKDRPVRAKEGDRS